MAVTEIEKRDGTKVPFDKEKIIVAVMKAMKEVLKDEDEKVIHKNAANIATSVVRELNKEEDIVDVEHIQDIVEHHLMKKYPDVARAYITYRDKRTQVRNRKSETMKEITSIIHCDNVKNSNANVDEYSFGGRKKESSDLIQKEIALNELIDPDIAEAFKQGRLYIHDLSEYAVGLHNCLNADVAYLLKNGFEARNGGVRPANSFATACQLVAVIFQIQSQVQFGGVADTRIDDTLAPYVRKSFLKKYKTGLEWLSDDGQSYDDFSAKYGSILTTASVDAEWNIFEDYNPKAYKYAMAELDKEGLQSTQALYHNLNTLESRAGSQVPFTSINFGLNTTFEGRKVTEWILKASIEGIGKNHATSIFPIGIFKVKRDINNKPGTPNYDLKKLAIKSLTRRIYPNIVNCDYISNKPDVHPTYVIKENKFQSYSDKVGLRIDSYIDNTDKIFNSIKGSNSLIMDYELISLEDFVNSLKEHKTTIREDGLEVIDLRFVNKRYLIEDSSQKYNDYNMYKDDHYSRISYLLVDPIKKEVCITTDSFQYDIHTEQTEDSVTIKSVDHVDLGYPKYDPDTEMATMGCRTLITYDVNGMGYKKTGRGNVTPVTINLARIGIRHGICLGERKEPDIDGFFKELDELLDMAERELVKRFYHICNQDIRAGYFMYHNGTIADHEAAMKKGIFEAMKHGSNALGYIGVANACYAMFGCYQHQSDKALKFAIDVVKRIYDKAKECTKKYHLNFGAYATPEIA